MTYSGTTEIMWLLTVTSIFTSFEAEAIIFRVLRIKGNKPFLSVFCLSSDSQIPTAYNSGLFFNPIEIRTISYKEPLFHDKGQMPKRDSLTIDMLRLCIKKR